MWPALGFSRTLSPPSVGPDTHCHRMSRPRAEKHAPRIYDAPGTQSGTSNLIARYHTDWFTEPLQNINCTHLNTKKPKTAVKSKTCEHVEASLPNFTKHFPS